MATPSVLKLILPKSKTSNQSIKHPVVVSVKTNPDVFAVNQTVVPHDQLENEILKALQSQPDKSVLIKADQEVPVKTIVEVLDIGSKNQIKMGISTDKKK
jgi:biopolymer transport protein ExbD